MTCIKAYRVATSRRALAHFVVSLLGDDSSGGRGIVIEMQQLRSIT